jgi:hypothetical protein
MSTCAMSSSIPFGSVDDPPMAMVVAVVVASGGQGGGGEVAWSAPGAAHRQQLCGPNTEGPRMVCARSHSSPTDRRPRDRGGRTGVGRDRRQRGRPVVQSSASHTTCPWMVTICKRQWRSRRHGQLVSLSAPVGKERGALGRGGMARPRSKVQLLHTWFTAAENLPRSSTHTSSHRARGGRCRSADEDGVLSPRRSLSTGELRLRRDGSAFSAREVLSRALVDIDEANGVVRLSMVMGPVVMGPRGW